MLTQRLDCKRSWSFHSPHLPLTFLYPDHNVLRYDIVEVLIFRSTFFFSSAGGLGEGNFNTSLDDFEVNGLNDFNFNSGVDDFTFIGAVDLEVAQAGVEAAVSTPAAISASAASPAAAASPAPAAFCAISQGVRQ